MNLKNRVVVAVVDTGVDAKHPALRHAVNTSRAISFYGYSRTNQTSSDIVDRNGHGTHLAGIIAANPVGKDSVRGINPDATIMPIKFLNHEGEGIQLDAAKAIRYAVDNGANIINCCWGFFSKKKELEESIKYALEKKVIIVAAVGNSDTFIPEYPAAFNSVITVGAISKNMRRSTYSSYGEHLDFMSLGNDVYSTFPGSTYKSLTGTSQATAIVSGIISRILSVHPSMSTSDIYEMIKNHTKDMLSPGHDKRSGHGAVQIEKILTSLGINTLDEEPILVPVTGPSNDSFFSSVGSSLKSFFSKIINLFGF